MPCSTYFTNGQCTQRNITSKPPAPFTPSRLTILPERTSGSEKSGASLPSGCIVDSVRAMRTVYGRHTRLPRSEQPPEVEEYFPSPGIAHAPPRVIEPSGVAG